MNPIIKWPGGKSGEIGQIEHLIPDFDRYIEPFFGGGALFFHLQPKHALINDVSKSLMDFYTMVKSQDKTLQYFLRCYDDGFQSLIDVCHKNYSVLSELYISFSHEMVNEQEMTRWLTIWMPSLVRRLDVAFLNDLVLDRQVFQDFLVDMVSDKFKRTVANENKEPFTPEDLKNNLITGFTSGFYMYFRKVYNDIGLGRILAPSNQYTVANFYFIREYCYGSMFRYNKSGEFNIPYGGISYNKKDFKAKIYNIFNTEIETLFQNTVIHCEDFETFLEKAALTANDFVFLSPPNDIGFSDYDGENFTRDDHKRLADLLSRTPAKFIVMIRKTDFLLSLYNDKFNIATFSNQYSFNTRSHNKRDVEHLIITNLPITFPLND